MALEALDILAGWGETSTIQTERMIAIAMASVAFKLGVNKVVITRDDIDRMLSQYYPESEGNLSAGVTLRLTRIEDLGETRK